MPDDNEVEFSNLPVRIRELIRYLWETNPEICSPFGSTGDPNDLHDQIGQPSLVDQTVSDCSEDQESLEAERREENQPGCENENSADNEKQNLLVSSLPEQHVPEDPAAPETLEAERSEENQPVCENENSEDNEKQNLLITSLPEQNVPEDPATLEISEQQRKLKGKGVAYEDSETSADRQLMVFEGNHTPAEIDAAPDSGYDSDRPISALLTEVRKAAKNKNKRKPKFSKNQSFRWLSDVNTELVDEHLEIPFPNELEDDITQISSSELKEESPRSDEAGPSNHGLVNRNGCTEPCGSGSVVGRVSMAKPLNQGHSIRSSRPSGSGLALGRDKKAKPSKRKPKRLNSDIEIYDPLVEEAAGILLSFSEEMTRAIECQGLADCNGCQLEAVQASVVNGSPDETEMVQASEVNGSPDETEMGMEMEMEMVQEQERERENVDCTLNQNPNPAEFNTEDAD